MTLLLRILKIYGIAIIVSAILLTLIAVVCMNLTRDSEKQLNKTIDSVGGPEHYVIRLILASLTWPYIIVKVFSHLKNGE